MQKPETIDNTGVPVSKRIPEPFTIFVNELLQSDLITREKLEVPSADDLPQHHYREHRLVASLNIK